MTYHLGEVWKHELRDALRAAGPDPDKLDKVRSEYGIEPRSEALSKNHVNYIGRLFHELNEGARKQRAAARASLLEGTRRPVLLLGRPRALIASMSPLQKSPSTTARSTTTAPNLVRLRDEEVLAIRIDAACADAPRVHAPTPKMIDDLLLEHAQGKLIDLPSFGEGNYIQADDGGTGYPSKTKTISGA